MAKTKKEPRKIKSLYLSEFIILLVLSLFFITGLVFAILGMFAFNVGKLADNPLYQAQKSFATFFKSKEGAVFDFRIFGTIVMVVSMLGFLLSVYLYSLKETKEIAKKRRIEERNRILSAESSDLDNLVTNK